MKAYQWHLCFYGKSLEREQLEPVSETVTMRMSALREYFQTKAARMGWGREGRDWVLVQSQELIPIKARHRSSGDVLTIE